MKALAQCLLGFAVLDRHPGNALLLAVHQRLAACAAQVEARTAAACLWALAHLRALPPHTWNALSPAFPSQEPHGQSQAGEQSSAFEHHVPM